MILVAVATFAFIMPAAAQMETPVVIEETTAVESTDMPADGPAVATPVVATETIAARQAQTPGTVEITYWICPPNVDFTLHDSSTLTSACFAQANGFTFQLSTVGGSVYTNHTGSGGLSKVTFPDVQPGAQTLRQIPPPETGITVFCGGNTPDGTSTHYGPVHFDGTFITFDLLPAEIFQCDWFVTFPGLDDAELDTGSVRIIVRYCPPGFDPGAGNLHDYAFGCQEGGGRMDFALAQTGSAIPLTVASSGGDGTNEANFGAVNPGTIAITGSPPAGFAEPVVFCTSRNPITHTRAMLVTNGNTIEWDLQESQQVGCTWFNVRQDAGTTIIDTPMCAAENEASTGYITDLALGCHGDDVLVDSRVSDSGGQGSGTTSNRDEVDADS